MYGYGMVPSFSLTESKCILKWYVPSIDLIKYLHLFNINYTYIFVCVCLCLCVFCMCVHVLILCVGCEGVKFYTQLKALWRVLMIPAIF